MFPPLPVRSGTFFVGGGKATLRLHPWTNPWRVHIAIYTRFHTNEEKKKKEEVLTLLIRRSIVLTRFGCKAAANGYLGAILLSQWLLDHWLSRERVDISFAFFRGYRHCRLRSIG